MCGSAKSSKAQQTAAQSAQDAERRAAEENYQAGLEARRMIMEAGKETPAETERLGRYTTAAKTPGETLLQQAGPISQAVARRIQERIDRPGLDYERNLPAYTEGITQPLWRSLKARGIAPPPGTEGGGLATQQYMKGAEPALAGLRAGQISEDITRGERYGASAIELNKFYQELENTLAEAIRGRQIQTTEEGAPYAVRGTQLKGQGMTAAETINQAEVQSRYAKKDAEKEQIGKMAAMIALGAISGGAGSAGGGMSAMGGGKGGGGIDPQTLALIQALKGGQTSSADLLLEKRAQGRATRTYNA